MEDRITAARFRNFFLAVLICVVIIVGRLWYLQIVQGAHFARLADGNRMRQIRLTPYRGVMYDRHGSPLVRSRHAFTVSIVPGGLKDAEKVLPLLSELLNLSIEDLQAAVEKGRGYPYEPVRVLRDVDAATLVAVEENRLRLPGVFIEEEPVREYLRGDLASHVIGHLGIISEQELRNLGTGYRGSDLVGKSGLEQTYETELRGSPGALTVEVNALSRPIQTLGSYEPIPGKNLLLTIDAELQEAAEQAFAEHTEQIRETYPEARNGAVVAMNPKTGEILAMVSIPQYEPGKLLDAKNRNEYFTHLSRDKRLPLFNRAVHGQYGPGSSFKPFTAVAILEEGVYRADQIFNATGRSRYGVRDWVITRGLAPFGEIDMRQAIAMSSNHYFAEQGVKLGIDRLSAWARAFGFGSPTGLEITPPEAEGIVPDREWKRQRFAGLPYSEQVWYPSDTEQVSIGQGFITVTPLQLAAAYSAIANRGPIYRPLLVKEIVDPGGENSQVFEPEMVREVEASERTWQAVIEGMAGTISHPRGTAYAAFQGFPISAAGKTGSYEVPGRDSHGLFAAFAPVEDPEIVVVVVVEHGGGGGSGAAPIARRVLDAYFGF